MRPDTEPSGPPEVREDALLLARRIAYRICRRYAVGTSDAEDIASEILLKLIENDYAVLRRFRGESSLEGYLGMVVHNHFRDWRIKRWGKWRHSTMAKRLGGAALLLDCLITRDGLSAVDAVETLLTRDDIEESRQQLEEIAEQLPRRQPRARIEGGEDSQIHLNRAIGSEDPEQRLMDAELGKVQQNVRSTLNDALADLSDEDRLILQLKFFESAKIVDIARMIGVEQKRLYPRIKSIELSIRRKLTAAGISAEAVKQLIEWTDLDLDID